MIEGGGRFINKYKSIDWIIILGILIYLNMRERERAILVVGRIYMYINIDIIWEIFFLLGDYNIYVYLNYFRYIGILLY